jgi:hypothetical protein
MKSFRQVFLFALIATLAVTAILVLNPLLVSSVLASLQKKVSPLQSAPASAPPKDPRYGTLVLDLAGDGVAFSSLGGRGSVYWNFTGGTVANAASWIAAGSALLAIDRNQDTIINNQTELFGNDQIDGFTALASLDTNSDHKITVADAQWQDLLVWTDTRIDGYSQPDELHHLDELGITAIDLGAQIVAYEVAGNLVTLASTFTIDGQMHEVVNATFARDKVNTVYNADFTLDARALFLPTLRGYGNLPSIVDPEFETVD